MLKGGKIKRLDGIYHYCGACREIEKTSVFTSEELKTENHDGLFDLMAAAAEFVVVNIADDLEGRDATD